MSKRVRYEVLCEERMKLFKEMVEALESNNTDKYKELLKDFCIVATQIENLLEEQW